MRITKKTVFNILIGNHLLPKSICRFLASMIDIGPNTKCFSPLPNAKSGLPFASFEDAILDLEQMIAQPQIFLHDSQFSPVEFGQKYYSRQEEVTTLMKLAIDIMDPSVHLPGVQAAFDSGIAG